MIPSLSHFPVDPAYGTGRYRRRLRFRAQERAIAAQVDDSHHSYWLTLDHNGSRVTRIEAGFNRAPTNVCAGSTAGLEMLVGKAIDTPAAGLIANLPPAGNCTHLSDLAAWALAEPMSSATWDIEVPDQAGLPVWITIAREGMMVHRWRVADFTITEPRHLAGKPLMAGFMRWAREAFAGRTLLAATMLQRGLFVARGRVHIVDRGSPMPLARAAGMAGMCWAYSDDRLAKGTGALDYVRDFSDHITEEIPPPHVAALLKDLPS